MPHDRIAILLAATALAACGGQPRGPGGETMEAPAATVSLVDSTGARVGVATFSDSGGTGRLSVSVNGLKPGRHGIHVHETGTCTPPGFESAGGHYNPDGKQHGLDNPAGPHVGDLPNLVVEEDGSVDTTLTASAGALAQGASSMLGEQPRALVIHAGPDDQKTDPSGSSGARVVCGVIERG